MKINFFPVEPSARVKYSMALVNECLNQMSTSPTREKPLIIRGLNAVQIRYLWTALMVWGKYHPTLTFGFNEIKILWDHIFSPREEYQIGWLWSDFTATSLYKTVFKQYLTPDMLIPVEHPQAFEDVPVSVYKTIAEQEQFKIAEAQNPEEAWQQKEARIKEEVLKREDASSQEEKSRLEESRKREDALTQEEIVTEEKQRNLRPGTILFFEKVNQLPSLDQLRRMVLCEAIERYRLWRNNPNGADKRGYHVSSMTWLWHYTAFGEQRANQLVKKLLAAHDDCLSILKQHCSDYTSINDHSLDTYLLEAIWETKVLFPIQAELSDLRTVDARKQLLNIILTTDTFPAPENPDALVPSIVRYLFSELHLAHKKAIPDYFALCLHYERHEDTDNELCFDAFALLAKAGIEEVLPVLERLAYEGSKEQQIRLSTIYQEMFNNDSKATYWEKIARNTLEMGM